MVTLKELRQDFQAWCKWKNIPSGITSFLILFFKYAEYRRLVDFRLKSGGLGWMRIFTYPTSYHLNLYIVCKKIKTGGGIGGGVSLMHGFSTMILVKEMGMNCMVNQQVTIGWANGGVPTIGNNVWIAAGAKVLGPITIGDDVIIGANAVVVKDVPSHSIVAGVPAKIIKRRNHTDEPWITIK